MDTLLIASVVMGVVIGVVISFAPVYGFYHFMCKIDPRMRGARRVWGLIGFFIWLLIYPLYIYFDRTHKLLIFSGGGGESGMIAGGVMLLISFCTSAGFILSGILIAHRHTER